MSSTNRPKREGSDFYQTPKWCCDLLAEQCAELDMQPNHIIDLGAGDGRIGRTVRERIGGEFYPLLDLVEINIPDPIPDLDTAERYSAKDAIKYLEDVHHDQRDTVLIVSNPPFNNARGFLEMAHEVIYNQRRGSVAVFLLRLNWLGSLDRSTLINNYPPTRINILAPRPSFTGGGTDSSEYAWIWWETLPPAGPLVEVLVDPAKAHKVKP